MVSHRAGCMVGDVLACGCGQLQCITECEHIVGTFGILCFGVGLGTDTIHTALLDIGRGGDDSILLADGLSLHRWLVMFEFDLAEGTPRGDDGACRLQPDRCRAHPSGPAVEIAVDELARHDLRRTCAKLCRKRAGKLGTNPVPAGP
jgi:hypothetical protein